MDPKRPRYQRIVRWTVQGLTEPISFAVVILQRRKVVKCLHFTGKRAISQKLNDVCSVWPSSKLKIVDLGYRSSLSVAYMVRYWFNSFQNSTVLLAVYTHEVLLCLCSVFCSRSLVRLSTAGYRVFGARTTPRTVSRNLKLLGI